MSCTIGTRFSSASARSLAATSPAPLATTRGAPFAGSYFSATATWVGLTSRTSASATSLIIRLRDIAICTAAALGLHVRVALGLLVLLL